MNALLDYPFIEETVNNFQKNLISFINKYYSETKIKRQFLLPKGLIIDFYCKIFLLKNFNQNLVNL